MGNGKSTVQVNPSIDQKDTHNGPIHDLANMLISLNITDDACLRSVCTFDKNAKAIEQIKSYRYPKYTNNCGVVLSEAAYDNTLLHLAVSNDKRRTAVEIARRVPDLVFDCVKTLELDNAAFKLTPLGIAVATNPMLAIDLINIVKNRKPELKRLITGLLKDDSDSVGLHTDSASEDDDSASVDIDSARENNNSTTADKDSARERNDSARENKDSARVVKDSARLGNGSASLDTDSARGDKYVARVDQNSARVDKDSARVDKDSVRDNNDSIRENKDSIRENKDSIRENKDSIRDNKDSARVDKDSARVDKDSAIADKGSARDNKVSIRENKDSVRDNTDSIREIKDSARVDTDSARVDTDSARLDKDSAREKKDSARGSKKNKDSARENKKNKDSARENKDSARENKVSARENKDSARENKDSARENKDSARVDKASARVDNGKPGNSVAEGQAKTILGGTVLMGQLPLHIAVLHSIAKQYVRNQEFKQGMKDTQDTHSQPSGYSAIYKKLAGKTTLPRPQSRGGPHTATGPQTGKHSTNHANTRDSFGEIKPLMNKLKKYGASVGNRNYIGDTVFHSILRFVNCFPEKENVAVKVMENLIRWGIKDEDELRDVLWAKNNDEVTVLQLAMEFGQTKVFTALMTIKGVYYHSDNHYDELYETQTIDVTELDKPTMWHAWKMSIAC